MENIAGQEKSCFDLIVLCVFVFLCVRCLLFAYLFQPTRVAKTTSPDSTQSIANEKQL